MSLRCVSNTSNTKELVEEWNQYTYAIQEDLETIDSLCKDIDTLAPKQLQKPLERLQANLDKIQKVFEIVTTKIDADPTPICGYPQKKVKALVFTAIGTGGLVFGLGSLAISELDESSTGLKWTGYAFCLAGAACKKVGDFLWNNWGNAESQQKMLLELKARASIISNTETTIHILNNLMQLMEIKNDTSIEIKTPQITHISPRRYHSTDGAELPFTPLMQTLKTVAETKRYRLSKIFKAPLNFTPTGTTHLHPSLLQQEVTSLHSITVIMDSSNDEQKTTPEIQLTIPDFEKQKTKAVDDDASKTPEKKREDDSTI